MKIDKTVVKVASRCNINCTYCYMYNLGDLSYKSQPKFIADSTTRNFAEKMLLHAKKHNLKTVSIIIHGGEPLLMSKVNMQNFINHFDIIKEENIGVRFALQTNGILVDDEWCDFFKLHHIGIGVSLDGNKEINDRSRVDKNGNGTYDSVIRGIDILRKNNITHGILSVLNVEADPIDYYESFKEVNIASLDVLLLEMNYDNKHLYYPQNITVAEWYISLFDRWYNDKDRKFSIRIFNVLIKEILGQEQGIDALGVAENNVLVLETDGGLEAVDVLKMCGDSFTKNDLNINSNDIDEIAGSDLIDVYYNSGRYLPEKCLACPVGDICGGGYLPHRYSAEKGFNNPSVYCNDLLKIITHIQNTVIDAMPEQFIKDTGLEKLTYEEALKIIDDNLSSVVRPEYIDKLESFKKMKRLPVLN
jgi:uncharacterized protein